MSKNRTVKIGPVHYRIEEIEDLRDGNEKLDGDIKYTQCKIYVEANLAGPAKRQVLWHEIFHAMLVSAGRREHDDEMIDALAYSIMQVLQDNPFLAMAEEKEQGGSETGG